MIATTMLASLLLAPQPAAPFKLAIAGLVHGHVHGFLHAMKGRTEVELVGVFDPDPALHRQAAQRHGLAPSLFFTDLATMLDTAKPEAVASFTSTYDHPQIVEACASRHIHVMMEKPLAVSMEHARAIRGAAERSGIQVIVNYETTWYPSHGAAWKLLKEQHAAGDIRKMVALDGHSGPKEIGVEAEFLDWLTDPVKDGGGALFDFGCYGANLMTWLMDGERPRSVTAITQQIKPAVYPKVDDEATILLEYPKAQGIVEASWNWPFSRKDLEIYAETGYAIAIGRDALRTRVAGGPEQTPSLDPLPADERDPISYLTAVVRGGRKPSGLSSLENNMIVVEILEAARESARSHKTVLLEHAR
jgi:predicted dehydrogenase